jgi:hypothetical protein
LGFPFVDDSSKRRVWSTYQKLRMRLCIGSSTPESIQNAWDQIVSQEQNDVNAPEHTTFDNTKGRFLGIGLATLSPKGDETLAFVMDKTELYIAMKGNDYEL